MIQSPTAISGIKVASPIQKRTIPVIAIATDTMTIERKIKKTDSIQENTTAISASASGIITGAPTIIMAIIKSTLSKELDLGGLVSE